MRSSIVSQQSRAGADTRRSSLPEVNIQSLADAPPKLTSLHLENWINDILDQCDQLEQALDDHNKGQPSIFKHKIQIFKLSQAQLQEQQLTKEQINGLYRGLYTYSHGFYKTLCAWFGRMTNKNNRSLMVANAWQVFAILLEHCCKHDVKMMIKRN